ncbi:MAG: carbon monoxide dehydrogenase subunit G [Anaerolineae bacterium]
MDVAGDFTFDAPQDLVWKALQDPNVLGSVMPGGKGFAQTGENQYSGTLEVKVGPVQGTFQGQITLSDIVAPQSYKIKVDGKGPAGFVNATGSMRLEPRGSGTFMEYSGQAQVGGRIASVGQRLMDSAARSIIRQSLEALNAYLTIEVAKQLPAAPVTQTEAPVAQPITEASAEPAPVSAAPEYKPPSQTALAFNVARDVLNDIVPAKYQPWILVGLIVIILLILLATRSS